MNILYISDLAGMGGGEVSLLHIMTEMKKNNNVFLLCRVDGRLIGLAEKEGIKTFCYDFKKNIVKSVHKFKKIITQEHIQVVHSNEITTGILHGIILKILGVKNKKNIVTCHGQWYKLSHIKLGLMNVFIDHIFCVSKAVEKNLNDQGYKKTAVSYLGVPKYNRNISNKFKEELSDIYDGVVDDAIIIITVARFQKIKGQLKGVMAIEKLHRRIPNIIYLLVGDSIFGSDEDDRYKSSVKEYVAEKNMEGYVKFLGERNDVPDIMEIADYVMITSDNESFGMVCVEAVAEGKIVVSTPCDGIKEILDYNRDMISDTNDFNGLYSILYKEITDNDYRERSYKAVCSRQNIFTIGTVCSKYYSQYV